MVSSRRTVSLQRLAIVVGNRSPRPWPRESFMSRSVQSMKSTATCPLPVYPRQAHARRSRPRARLQLVRVSKRLMLQAPSRACAA